MSFEVPRFTGKNVLKAAGVGAAVWYGATYFDESGRRTPIWKYVEHPRRAGDWDRVVRVLTEPQVRLADDIIDHGWDLVREPKPKGLRGMLFPADPKAFPRKNVWDDIRVDFPFGWQKAAVVGLDTVRLNERHQAPKGWNCVFAFDDEDVMTRCRIVIPPHESVRILLGDRPTRVFTLDLDGNELPSRGRALIHRRDPRFKNLRLL